MNNDEQFVTDIINALSGDTSEVGEFQVPEFSRNFCSSLNRLIRAVGRVKSKFTPDDLTGLALGTLDAHFLWTNQEWSQRFDQYTLALSDDVEGCSPEEAIRAFNYLAVNLVAMAILEVPMSQMPFNQRAAFARMGYQFWRGLETYARQFDPSQVEVINSKFQAAGFNSILEHYPGVPVGFGYTIVYFLIGIDLS